MSNATQILIATTLALTAACGYMIYRVDTASDRAEASEQVAARQQAHIARLDSERLSLQREVARLRGLADWRRPAGLAGGPAGGPVPPPPAAQAKNGAPLPMPELSGESRASLARGARFNNEWMETPAGREMLRAQRRMGVQRMYTDFFREHDMSPEQIDKFVALMADREMQDMTQMQQLRADPQELQKFAKEREARSKSELTALLGADGYKEFESYRSSFGERMELNQVADQLEVMRVPLRDDQRSELLTAMVEERKRTPMPTYTQEATPEENMQKNLDWKQDYDQRVRDRVASVLDSDQLKRFTDYQEMQQNMQRMGLQFSRRVRVNAGPNGGTSDVVMYTAPAIAVAPGSTSTFVLTAPPAAPARDPQ